MEGADARRQEHRRGIVRKANDANSKVRALLLAIAVCSGEEGNALFQHIAHARELQPSRLRVQPTLAFLRKLDCLVSVVVVGRFLFVWR